MNKKIKEMIEMKLFKNIFRIFKILLTSYVLITIVFFVLISMFFIGIGEKLLDDNSKLILCVLCFGICIIFFVKKGEKIVKKFFSNKSIFSDENKYPIQNIQTEVNEEIYYSSLIKKPVKSIIWGIILAMGGILISYLSYTASEFGGTYYMFYGLVIYGIIKIGEGLKVIKVFSEDLNVQYHFNEKLRLWKMVGYLSIPLILFVGGYTYYSTYKELQIIKETIKLEKITLEKGKEEIEELESNLSRRQLQVESLKRKMDNYKLLGEIDLYNSCINSYNSLIKEYRNYYEAYEQKREEYHIKVKKLNQMITK